MPTVNGQEITIISVLIAGITGLWAFFTKKDAQQEKEKNIAAKERETALNTTIKQKDDLIVKLAQDSIKSTTELKGVIENNTAMSKDTHALTTKVLEELIRLKTLNGVKS